MDPFIFDSKKGISIIDLEKTKKQLEEALKVAQDLASQNKVILFVGTKRQAKEMVKAAAEDCGMPYVVECWIGGLITNYSSVSQSTRKLSRLKKELETGELKKYTKKEQLQFKREIKKLEKIVGGIEQIDRVPDAVFVTSVKDEATVVREANKKGIPVIGVCDTNANPDKITYPIPANDDALMSLKYITEILSDTIKNAPQPTPKEEPKKINKK